MTSSPIPNFFIIGAPKCGTTSMARYLGDHPAIFMSGVKEPHYLTTDWPGMMVVKSLDNYLALFADAQETHQVIGEASTGYIYTQDALKNIFAFNPTAKIVAMLRNPVDLAYAYHMQLLYQADEDETDFERAWALQPERQRGLKIPKTCREPKKLQYRSVAALGSQVERLMAIFPAEQVKLILFDDFVRSPKATYEEILSFLGLESDGRQEFPKVNEAKVASAPQWRVQLASGLRSIYSRFFWLVQLKKFFGLEPQLRIWDILVQVKNQRREPLRPEFKQQLTAEFKPEIEKLANLLGRDLSHWLRTN